MHFSCICTLMSHVPDCQYSRHKVDSCQVTEQAKYDTNEAV